MKTNLILNKNDENKIVYDAVSYYHNYYELSDEDAELLWNNPDKFIETAPSDSIKIIKDIFSIVNENGTWKVDEFTHPMC